MKKKEGFEGQKAVVIPRTILSQKCAKDPAIGNLYVTDMGYYPKALYHYRERPQGADQHILIYCYEGGGSARIGGTEYNLVAGDFIIIPAKAAHAYEASQQNPWTIYWLHFKGNSAASLLSQFEKQQNGHKGFIRSSATVLDLFNEMYDQLTRGYGADNLMYTNMCLWHFLGKFIYNNKYQQNGVSVTNDPVDKAIDFLSKKVETVLTLEEIASEVNLSSAHFSVTFKKKTGFSPIEYFNHLKVQKACQYLLFTNLRIKEIAPAVGIDDHYYFSRLFTKVMGISPNEYRLKKGH
ncbi:MAG TPA: AraC family transcriptional regulator [Flavisolibacter sp.]|nr:AraC family transcriptional regulator [Flavisolibacter sp.]